MKAYAASINVSASMAKQYQRSHASCKPLLQPAVEAAAIIPASSAMTGEIPLRRRLMALFGGGYIG